jgi:hypothetical protein
MIAMIVALAAAVGAGPPAQPAGQVQDPSDTKRICRKITYTGSRLGAVSVCHSKREWDEIQWEHDHLVRERQLLDRALNSD